MTSADVGSAAAATLGADGFSDADIQEAMRLSLLLSGDINDGSHNAADAKKGDDNYRHARTTTANGRGDAPLRMPGAGDRGDDNDPLFARRMAWALAQSREEQELAYLRETVRCSLDVEGGAGPTWAAAFAGSRESVSIESVETARARRREDLQRAQRAAGRSGTTAMETAQATAASASLSASLFGAGPSGVANDGDDDAEFDGAAYLDQLLASNPQNSDEQSVPDNNSVDGNSLFGDGDVACPGDVQQLDASGVDNAAYLEELLASAPPHESNNNDNNGENNDVDDGDSLFGDVEGASPGDVQRTSTSGVDGATYRLASNAPNDNNQNVRDIVLDDGDSLFGDVGATIPAQHTTSSGVDDAEFLDESLAPGPPNDDDHGVPNNDDVHGHNLFGDVEAAGSNDVHDATSSSVGGAAYPLASGAPNDGHNENSVGDKGVVDGDSFSIDVKAAIPDDAQHTATSDGDDAPCLDQSPATKAPNDNDNAVLDNQGVDSNRLFGDDDAVRPGDVRHQTTSSVGSAGVEIGSTAEVDPTVASAHARAATLTACDWSVDFDDDTVMTDATDSATRPSGHQQSVDSDSDIEMADVTDILQADQLEHTSHVRQTRTAYDTGNTAEGTNSGSRTTSLANHSSACSETHIVVIPAPLPEPETSDEDEEL
jgi:hypothetical protein